MKKKSQGKRDFKVPKEYLGAFKKGHRYSVRDEVHEDLSWSLLNRIIDSKYTDTAAMEALAFLSKFNNEYLKNVIKKGDETALHNTDALRKDCYYRTNCRNRDIMSINQNKPAPIRSNKTEHADQVLSITKESYIEQLLSETVQSPETYLIDLMEEKNSYARFLELSEEVPGKSKSKKSEVNTYKSRTKPKSKPSQVDV